MTQRQQAVIVGNILGDGYIHWDGYKGSSLEVRQKIDHHDYIMWLYDELRDMCNRVPYLRSDNKQWRLYTRYLLELTNLRQKFYQKGRKVVPLEIASLLKDPLSLAVWFMDDGTSDQRVKDHLAFSLITNNFNKAEHERLKLALLNNFDLKVSIQKTAIRGRSYLRLYIGANARSQFLKLIAPYIVPSFRYKLPINYRDPSETDFVAQAQKR